MSGIINQETVEIKVRIQETPGKTLGALYHAINDHFQNLTDQARGMRKTACFYDLSVEKTPEQDEVFEYYNLTYIFSINT